MNNYEKDLLKHIDNIDNTKHSNEEKEGLKEVYKKIGMNKISPFTNLAVDLMMIQQTLYSKCACKIGEFRKANTCISCSNVSTCEYNQINKRIDILNNEYLNLIKFSKTIANEEQLNDYIKACIRLKCKLIQIHPFNDGNGRTCRAIFDYLLRQVEISPVNIENDRDDYIAAMNKAVTTGNYDLIDSYYSEKIMGGKKCQKLR